ncbi:MAG: metalloregulator ArsR/SmtB family transcription factor [Clostridia bacterium]|nr:metalloregulator ArsR/SmtB family transcription factor [Clostridia bacterium]
MKNEILIHLNEITNQLQKTEDFENIADLFKILADSSRLKIFLLLCHIEACVIEIAKITDMSTPAVSHHLKLLKITGLIESNREGREVYYKATDIPKAKLLHEVIEQTMKTVCPNNKIDSLSKNTLKYSEETVTLVRDAHNYLISNLDKRITIDELSKKFHINKTSLKELFKSFYGVSIAKHILEHRMEAAAYLLNNTSDSVAAISKKVGYQTQSKFTLAFKEFYNETPLKYRKNHSNKK